MTSWVLHATGDVDDVNRHLARLRNAGLLGTAEVDGGTDVYLARRVDDLDLGGTWEQIPDTDWHARSRTWLTPVAAGPWTITPSWLATGAPGEVVIDPGRAFGTGHHETTASCLRALGRAALAGARLLDLGTGSGVLGIAAAQHGATVVAVDVDPLAVQAARRNARRNGVDLDVRLGDEHVVAGEVFDVVVSNLSSAVLRDLAGALVGMLAAGGTLIASGIGNEHAASVGAALCAAGLVTTPTPGLDWTLMHATRAST